MIKTIFLILLHSLLMFALLAQKPAKDPYYIQNLSDTDTLQLSYFGGDDGYDTYKLLIFKSGKSLFAERHGDPLFVGKQCEPIWRKKLVRKYVKMTNQYIQEMKTNQKCVGTSSAYENIFMSIRDDTIAHYKGYCWFGFPIEYQLFEDEYRNLAKRQKSYENSLSNLLKGIWYPGVIRSDSTWKYLYLFRTYQPGKSYASDCIWQFDLPDKFNSQCDVFNLGHSKKYTWRVNRGEIGLDIEPGILEDENNRMEVVHDGKEYIIVRITPQYIILKNRWGF